MESNQKDGHYFIIALAWNQFGNNGSSSHTTLARFFFKAKKTLAFITECLSA
jgi:hypothetical protein